jgi:hypothetical protein
MTSSDFGRKVAAMKIVAQFAKRQDNPALMLPECDADSVLVLIGELERYTRMSGRDIADDYVLIGEAVRAARQIQEFIWDSDSRVHLPFDAEAWGRLFQKRVDAITAVDVEHREGRAELRKRLLQQAALSIKALAVIGSTRRTT